MENIGGSPADNVRVRVPLPDTVEPVSADLTGPDWTCSVTPDPEAGQRVWECAHPRYEPHSIEHLSRIVLTATVGAGTPEAPCASSPPLGPTAPSCPPTTTPARSRRPTAPRASSAARSGSTRTGTGSATRRAPVGFAGGDEVTAESAVIDVVDGRYTVVDIGLVPAQP